LDHGDIAAKREHLVHHLGLPSLEVMSGGVTLEGQHKLHLYWKLTKPALGADIATVCRLRGFIAEKVAGDPSFRSAHQPIRVAGSVYRKGGVERLTTILTENPAQYELDEFAIAVKVMPSLDGENTSEADADIKTARKGVAELVGKRVREGGVDGTTRFEALSSVIGHWIRLSRLGDVTKEEAWKEIVAYNEEYIEPPWPLDRLKHEAAQLWRRDAERNSDRSRGSGNPPRNGNSGEDSLPAEFSEDALALEFTRRFGDDWSYVSVWGQWLTWSGTRWERETSLLASDLARLVCRDTAALCPKTNIKARLSSASTISAVERLARADRSHAAGSEQWDRDLWLLNTPACVVDLRTGEMLHHDRSRAMTKRTTASPNGNCPRWRRFLEQLLRAI
jgi:putative DNA primase/helicase